MKAGSRGMGSPISAQVLIDAEEESVTNIDELAGKQ